MHRTLFARGIALLVGALVLSCSGSPSGPEPPAHELRAITFVDWTARGYGRSAALASLEAAASTGANAVVFVVTAYQDGESADTIRTDRWRTPTRRAVGRAVDRAHELGLATILKPHVDLDNGGWRSEIRPPDPARWFDSYRRFLQSWATWADSAGVAQLVVGTELDALLAEEDEWRSTIDRIREVYRGELLYATTWSRAAVVPFWDALDLIGLNAYFPVASHPAPRREEILGEWGDPIAELRALRRRTGKRIVLTEIGYRSVDGAGMKPGSWEEPGEIDLKEQADLYWAALEATKRVPWIAGLYWWNWRADGGGGPDDDDYTPHGKPAEEVLRAAWRS